MTAATSLLILGGRDVVGGPLTGWHHRQLIDAASRLAVDLSFADYETLRAEMVGRSIRTWATCDHAVNQNRCERGLDEFDCVLTRTMPAGSLEHITFRLATLHDEVVRQRERSDRLTITNPPSSLELAIDKYATLVRAARLGIPVPETIVVQDRPSAMAAWDRLGGDVVVKPIFGGEGRGVMRIRERELAWTVFSTLQSCGAMMYVQKFVPPGGIDLRMLVIGEPRYAIRRRAIDDFRTNVRGGGTSERVDLAEPHRTWATQICQSLGLDFAAVDFLETERADESVLVEVNAIPGWKGAQGVVSEPIALELLAYLLAKVQ